MTSDFGRIAIREFSILSPSSWIPTAFYNCGPGYTNGTRNSPAVGHWLQHRARPPCSAKAMPMDCVACLARDAALGGRSGSGKLCR